MVSNARLRLNQAAPVSVVGSADTGVVQMMALLQDIGDELAERNFWQALDTPATITADGTTVLFQFPTAFGGLSPGLQFQSTLYPTLPVIGPVTDEQMASFKALPVTPLQPVWRVIDGQFEFYPAPASGEVYTFNYYSSMWVQSAAGDLQLSWEADTDISLIDEKILTTGLEWRWLKAKGLDYSEEFRRFEMRIARADGRQDTRREVSMSSRLVGGPGSWPGVIPLYDGSGTEGADFGFS